MVTLFKTALSKQDKYDSCVSVSFIYIKPALWRTMNIPTVRVNKMIVLLWEKLFFLYLSPSFTDINVIQLGPLSQQHKDKETQAHTAKGRKITDELRMKQGHLTAFVSSLEKKQARTKYCNYAWVRKLLWNYK